MKRITKDTYSEDELTQLIDNADALCKSFDSNSDCRKYLLEKIIADNCQTLYLVDNDQPIGICILEILDSFYGNVVLHCINETDEALFAALISKEAFLKSYIL